MSSILYIDGLHASVGQAELTGMCSRFGCVLSVDIYKPNTALSSGIGAVEMASLEEAEQAVSALHRSYLGGNLLLAFHAPLAVTKHDGAVCCGVADGTLIATH